TVACATDGNHGRSVAAGARFTGCRAVIFVHEGVAAERADAIAACGAEIRRVPGVYADAVAAAAREAGARGWILVADTASPGYERIPQLVAQGYTVMVREALAALPRPPTHAFVQAGVGGLASAVAGYLSAAPRRRAPAHRHRRAGALGLPARQPRCREAGRDRAGRGHDHGHARMPGAVAHGLARARATRGCV